MSEPSASGPDRGQIDAVLLADGSPAVVRPLGPDDRGAVTRLFDGCSDANLYTRFFSLGHAVAAQHVEHLFDPSAATVAYVVQQGDRVIGIADVEPVDTVTSEIAFLAADDAHGLGVATLLLERAAKDAREAGVLWFVADVLAVNHPMLQVFADAGFRIERHLGAGDVALRMSTEETEEARAAAATRHEFAEARRLAAEPTYWRGTSGDREEP